MRGGGGADQGDELVEVGFELGDGELFDRGCQQRGGGEGGEHTNRLRRRREGRIVRAEPDDEERRLGEGVGRFGEPLTSFRDVSGELEGAAEQCAPA